MVSGTGRYVFCYLLMPLSGLLMRWFAGTDRQLRFHARQSILFGLLYIVCLLTFSLLDAVGGALFRWAGAFVAAAMPVVGLFVMMVWSVVVLHVMRGHRGRIPLLAHWANR